jgi:hypothetical protein
MDIEATTWSLKIHFDMAIEKKSPGIVKRRNGTGHVSQRHTLRPQAHKEFWNLIFLGKGKEWCND